MSRSYLNYPRNSITWNYNNIIKLLTRGKFVAECLGLKYTSQHRNLIALGSSKFLEKKTLGILTYEPGVLKHWRKQIPLSCGCWNYNIVNLIYVFVPFYDLMIAVLFLGSAFELESVNIEGCARRLPCFVTLGQDISVRIEFLAGIPLFKWPPYSTTTTVSRWLDITCSAKTYRFSTIIIISYLLFLILLHLI